MTQKNEKLLISDARMLRWSARNFKLNRNFPVDDSSIWHVYVPVKVKCSSNNNGFENVNQNPFPDFGVYYCCWW